MSSIGAIKLLNIDFKVTENVVSFFEFDESFKQSENLSRKLFMVE